MEGSAACTSASPSTCHPRVAVVLGSHRAGLDRRRPEPASRRRSSRSSLPEALPATLVLVGVPLTRSRRCREHHALDRRALPWMLGRARCPGTVLGLRHRRRRRRRRRSAVIVGAVTLVGVARQRRRATGPDEPGERLGRARASSSNVFGTAAADRRPAGRAALPAPPGPTAPCRRSAACFTVAAPRCRSSATRLAGEIAGDQVLLALALVPGSWSSGLCDRAGTSTSTSTRSLASRPTRRSSLVRRHRCGRRSSEAIIG